ncbi:MAG: hypothetical protein IT446_10465 [Phycisphaerales bacterium]|jgi:hypothetical protein|nr:hypothetical protein [Phycisphaerales bacterium]
MSRAATGDTVVIKPSNNVYTVLVVIATIVEILGLIVLFSRATTIFGTGLLG